MKKGMASNYGNLGGIYETRGEVDKAEEIWIEAKTLFKAIGDIQMVKQIQSWIDQLKE